jgi:hypothetical protein
VKIQHLLSTGEYELKLVVNEMVPTSVVGEGKESSKNEQKRVCALIGKSLFGTVSSHVLSVSSSLWHPRFA